MKRMFVALGQRKWTSADTIILGFVLLELTTILVVARWMLH